MNTVPSELADFGWNAFFEAQIDAGRDAGWLRVRVMAVHRDQIEVAGPGIEARIAPYAGDPADEEDAATIGDWLLVDGVAERAVRRLDRASVFKRRAAGTGRRAQLIAANVDTLFVVSSCNQDFNPARLERYLALARAAGVIPVVVLTKADLADDPESFAAQAQALMPGLAVETIDARDSAQVAVLAGWCTRGATVAMVGSSGVGKSTIVNTLMGGDIQATGDIREDDDRGRHTTSARSMHRMPSGGWLIDMPGMREVQLTDAEPGIDEVFADIAGIAEGCRFSDCRHGDEPGCAVRAAVEEGVLDFAELERYLKLSAEDARNTETLVQRRSRERGFGRKIREVGRERKRRGKE